MLSIGKIKLLWANMATHMMGANTQCCTPGGFCLLKLCQAGCETWAFENSCNRKLLRSSQFCLTLTASHAPAKNNQTQKTATAGGWRKKCLPCLRFLFIDICEERAHVWDHKALRIRFPTVKAQTQNLMPGTEPNIMTNKIFRKPEHSFWAFVEMEMCLKIYLRYMEKSP